MYPDGVNIQTLIHRVGHVNSHAWRIGLLIAIFGLGVVSSCQTTDEEKYSCIGKASTTREKIRDYDLIVRELLDSADKWGEEYRHDTVRYWYQIGRYMFFSSDNCDALLFYFENNSSHNDITATIHPVRLHFQNTSRTYYHSSEVIPIRKEWINKTDPWERFDHYSLWTAGGYEIVDYRTCAIVDSNIRKVTDPLGNPRN